ncbi:hypothetical protein I3U51_21945 [Mycobacteroides abscessus subsp. abscessus]|uniref:hypothetical protein n=1 Tax=Mycobacteroides abscessus TaxID=36809 RepID=UPI0009D4D02F|nr:hypothetical protein [Mycobacteroides abscessus]MBN7443200.1 hypothetical protein [Mycobacteroides abscessus subsp. abscessus]SLH82296.1 Uncharacterised protein [Mycobacteroides abscessus subsp. abscessus]
MNYLLKGWSVRIRAGRMVLAVPPAGFSAAYRLTAVESTVVAHELALALARTSTGYRTREHSMLTDDQIALLERGGLIFSRLEAMAADSDAIRWGVVTARTHLVLRVSPADPSGVYTLSSPEAAALILGLIDGRRSIESFIIDQLGHEAKDGGESVAKRSDERPDEGGHR